MKFRPDWPREAGWAMKFAGVGLIGFATDILLLHVGLTLGLEPAWARAVSLFCAMQVTFAVNGSQVFRCLQRSRLLGQWGRYMATSGFGNLCNYFVFVSLVSTHWRIVSSSLFALCVGSACAYAINYLGARFIAFAGAGGLIRPPRRQVTIRGPNNGP